MQVKETFKYPDGTRMCVAGQRRAAVEAMDLALPGAEKAKDKIVTRAAKAEADLKKGRSVGKHKKISLVVADLHTKGGIQRHIDADGNYTVETFDGRKFKANIFEDLVDKKKIF